MPHIATPKLTTLWRANHDWRKPAESYPSFRALAAVRHAALPGLTVLSDRWQGLVEGPTTDKATSCVWRETVKGQNPIIFRVAQRGYTRDYHHHEPQTKNPDGAGVAGFYGDCGFCAVAGYGL